MSAFATRLVVKPSAGRYRSRFRICAALVEWQCLTQTKLNKYLQTTAIDNRDGHRRI